MNAIRNFFEQLRNLDARDVGRWPFLFRALAVVLVFAVATGLMVWYFVFSESQGNVPDLRKAEAEQQSLWATFDQKQRKAANLEAYRQQLAEIERTFGAMLRQLPGRTEVPSLLVDISQTGLAAGLLVKLFLMGTNDGVLADADIAAFALHPIGLTAIVIVGAVSLGVWFAELGVLMTIGFGAVDDRRVTWLAGVRYVSRHAARLVRLAGRIIARLLIIAAPFLAGVGGVYLLLLGRYDINFYLADKPPEFWWAVGLAGLLLFGLALLVLKAVSNWILAIPLVLFGAVGGREALHGSRRATDAHAWSIALWLAAWLVSIGLLSWLLAFAIGLIGDLLVPDVGASLVLMATGLALTLLVSFAVNLTVSIITTSLLPLFVVRLYRSLAGPGGGAPAAGPAGPRRAGPPCGRRASGPAGMRTGSAITRFGLRGA